MIYFGLCVSGGNEGYGASSAGSCGYPGFGLVSVKSYFGLDFFILRPWVGTGGAMSESSSLSEKPLKLLGLIGLAWYNG